MKNGKKSIALAMLLVLSLPMATMLIKSTYAVDAVGYGFSWWDGASAPSIVVTSSDLMPGIRAPYHTNDTLALNDYPWNDTNLLTVTFRVNNTQSMLGAGDIVRVQFHVWENASLGAVFHYVNSTGNELDWKTRILEKDTKGWARLIEFYLDDPNLGITPGQSMSFNVTFGAKVDGQTLDPSLVTPEFIVTSAYFSSLAEDQSIYWYLGAPPPTVTVGIIPAPVNGNVTGLLFGTGCGHHYFNVTFTATDMFGLLNYTISIVGPTTPPVEWHNATNGWSSYPTLYTNVTQWVDFLDGSYTVTVTVFNRMQMSASNATSFYYMHPQKPIGLSITSGYAAYDTWIADPVSGLVNSTQVVYGNKTFGTIVPVSGYGFGASKTVKITVYLPTYSSYHSKYGTYEVLVASATTDANGNFTTSFIFPKAPMGTYNVTGVSSTYTCATGFQVLPQIIYNPNIVIGPAVINVEATGFPVSNVDNPTGPSNFDKLLILCNNKDTLLGIDSQVMNDWFIDGNGTLQNVITSVLGGRHTDNGIVWPALQPGTNNISLVLYTSDTVNNPLRYWNSPTWQLISTNYFEHNNTITVLETLGLLIDIKNDTAYIRNGTDIMNAKLDQLNATITNIDGNVVTINTNVGSMKATLDQLSPVITRIDGNVVTINTNVGSISSTLNTLSPVITRIDGNVVTINSALGPMSTTLNAINATINTIDWNGLATLSTSFGQVNVTVTRIDGNVLAIKANTDTVPALSANVSSIKTNTDTIPNVPMTTYVIIILALLALIFAIVAAIESMRARIFIYKKTA